MSYIKLFEQWNSINEKSDFVDSAKKTAQDIEKDLGLVDKDSVQITNLSQEAKTNWGKSFAKNQKVSNDLITILKKYGIIDDEAIKNTKEEIKKSIETEDTGRKSIFDESDILTMGKELKTSKYTKSYYDLDELKSPNPFIAFFVKVYKQGGFSNMDGVSSLLTWKYQFFNKFLGINLSFHKNDPSYFAKDYFKFLGVCLVYIHSIPMIYTQSNMKSAQNYAHMIVNAMNIIAQYTQDKNAIEASNEILKKYQVSGGFSYPSIY